MTDLAQELRSACSRVAAEARDVQIAHGLIGEYAGGLPLDAAAVAPDPELELPSAGREARAAFWLTLDAINFGSGWFPTMRKREGRSGFFTIAIGIRERFAAQGPWSAQHLARIDAAELSQTLGQPAEHELIGLFVRSLTDLGRHLCAEYGGSFTALADSARGSAVGLAAQLGGWDSFADTSIYCGFPVPFLKRAQIAAADLERAGVARFGDLHRLTMFADNLVPHVLREDGVLRFAPGLIARIERGDLIEHGSREEVEIRACALHAVELIVALRPDSCAADVDSLLWRRGQQPRYKAAPRHRSRCRAY